MNALSASAPDSAGSVVDLFHKSLVDRAQHDIDRALADDLNEH